MERKRNKRTRFHHLLIIGFLSLGLLSLNAFGSPPTQEDNVTGAGDGTPSVATVDENTLGYTTDDVRSFTAMLNDLAQSGQRNTLRLTSDTVVTKNDDGTYNFNGVNTGETNPFGNPSAPKVTVVDGGSVSLRGDSLGTGILVVKGGHLDMRGTADYNGLIILMDDATASVGSRGTPSVKGATLTLADGNSYEEGTGQLDVRGNASLYYSTEGLELAKTALLNTQSWEISAMYEITADVTDEERGAINTLLGL